MIIGVPKEIKNHENRVAAVPAGVRDLVASGHQVLVQAGAGESTFWTSSTATLARKSSPLRKRSGNGPR
jgi:alanine dehydrogenase